ncbi:MAG: cytochrome c oxidase subunit I [Actinomycetota bacterium]|nr:cytochrome c oxidase subunit I [Actinomycetota bacterium]
MTQAVLERPPGRGDLPSDVHHDEGPSGILKWLTSTDHKVIGKSYLITSFIFFVIGGAMALVIRAQLSSPNNALVSQHQYNELFTMHGSIMLLLFAGPFAFAGFANYFVPLQVGAPDMAFPRLNALSYWLFLSGGLIMISGFLTTGGAADFGWVAYAPLSNATNSPGAGADMWIIALILTGFSAIFTGVNIVTTVFYLRAPGMTMFRVPIFTWNMLVVAILILIAFPVLTSALVMLFADRHFGTHIFEVQGGGVPVLWQHLFWFFGHPEVYIIALPYFGMVTDIIPVFSRKPLFGYKGMIFATMAIAALSTGVWAHHMFTTGVVLLPFFSLMSYLIAVPTGIKFFNWIATMWRGQIRFTASMLFCIGFLLTFLVGGLTGVLLASPPIDFATHDTYFVVAHFHSVVMALVMAGVGAIFYWYPKITNRMLNETLGKATFWFMFIGANVTFMPQYLLGLRGMPRRIATYPASSGFATLNLVSSAGAMLIAISALLLLWNFWISWRKPVPAGDNPWDAHTLEWATTSPPPHHNFNSLPPIRSERPVWDANHPEAALTSHGASLKSAGGDAL